MQDNFSSNFFSSGLKSRIINKCTVAGIQTAFRSAQHFTDVGLIIIDEAHRAVGDYAYVYIAEQYRKKAKNERILALTASPGSESAKVKQICDHLNIEEVEIRNK